MSMTQPEAGAQAHTNDEEEENEPDLLESDSDDDEPKAKKSKTSLNYGAKTTPASRARQYPPGTFEPRGESMWCMACQKPVDYKRKSVADAHLKTPAHKAKAKCKKKEKQPVQTTQPVGAENRAGAENPVAILTPGSSGNTMQPSLKDMLKARSVINDARDDLVAAFTAAGIPLKKSGLKCFAGQWQCNGTFCV